jgi:hypothetical protein
LRLAVELAAALLGIWQIGVLYSVFARRIGYPIDLEWMEGGTLYEAHRLLHGQSLYEHPVTTWVGFPYPPAHPLILAILGIIDLDFWTGRLVSVFFFTLLCAAILREIYVHLGRSALGAALGLLSVAFICNGFPVIGQWYDLIRADTMMFGLWAAGTARLLKPIPTRRHTLITALLFCAAVYSKQTGAMFIGWSCLFLLMHSPRVGLRLAIYTGAACLVVLGFLQWSSKGAFWFLTVASLGQHEVRDAIVTEGFRLVYKHAPFMVLTPFLLLLVALKRWLSPRSVLWVGSFLVAIPACLMPYAKVGAYLNALMPLVVLAAPAIVFVTADVMRQKGALAVAARWGTLAALSYFVCANPIDTKTCVPDAAKWRAARELNAIVASLKGGVVCPYLAFLPGHNGHDNPHWHMMVTWDAVWRGESFDEVAALKHSGARWVLLHSNDGGVMANYVRRQSRLAMRIPASARVRMVTGAGIEIDELWERPTGIPR